MSQPTLDQIAPGGVVQLNDAPAGLDETTFDDLFPADPKSQVTAPQVPETPAPSAGTQPAPAPVSTTPPASTTPPSAPFIKGEKSVYNTPEAAVAGINEKDAIIEQLRQRFALTTGIDPITGKPVGAPSVAPQEVNYAQDAQRYLNDLYEAAKKSPEAYSAVQQKFLQDSFAPQIAAIQPLVEQIARDRAISEVSKELPAFKDFYATPTYQRVLDQSPDLKGAIVAAESNSQFHSRLPGLYKIAYLAGQGLQLPEILAAQRTVPTQTQPAPRPTAQPGTLAPPQQTAKPSFKTLDGIRATIAEAEARGAKLDF